jgi:hypothetical protein
MPAAFNRGSVTVVKTFLPAPRPPTGLTITRSLLGRPDNQNSSHYQLMIPAHKSSN